MVTDISLQHLKVCLRQILFQMYLQMNVFDTFVITFLSPLTRVFIYLYILMSCEGMERDEDIYSDPL